MKYRHITISGGVGVGTTTLMNNLRQYLDPYGWQFKSNGEYVRELTQENVLPVATLVSNDIDKEIEARVVHTLQNDYHWVLEGWLTGFVARDNNQVLRILLYCSDPSLRVDRVVNRDKLSIDKAKQFIKLREEKNIKKWQTIYGKHDFFNPKHYTISIDTYKSGPIETVGKVLDALNYQVNGIEINKK